MSSGLKDPSTIEMLPFVMYNCVDSVGTIWLNNDAKRNALSKELVAEVIQALDTLAEKKARVVILRGNKGVKVWSSGHNVQELPEPKRDPLGWDDALRCLIRKVQNVPYPVIAMIEGTVWGGACEVAFACDLITATENVTFALTPAKLGVPYNPTGLITFMSVVGQHFLREMLYTAQPVSVARAELAGIVNHIYSADEIEAKTLELAKQIVVNAPLAIAAMKETLNCLSGAHAMSPMTFERIQGIRRSVYDSRDYGEGKQAFLEKRKPVFIGE